jgi:hypothetical protein
VADTAPLSYTLDSSPAFAFGQLSVTLLVGVEEQPDGKWRAYLGARWKGLYLLLDAEEAEPFRRAWGTGQHVWMAPVPPAELLHREELPGV